MRTEWGYNLQLETKWLRSVISNLHTEPHFSMLPISSCGIKSVLLTVIIFG